MKTRTLDRKERIELVINEALKLDSGEDAEMVQAWRRLVRELEFMTSPEARMPRFDSLLRTVWIAATNEQS